MSTVGSSVKNTLKRSPLLVSWVHKLRHARVARRLRGPRVMRRFARLFPEAFFIQVGANDGVQLDPLHEWVLSCQWRGIMIEPVPYVFENLKANYAHLQSRIALKNVAIAPSRGEMPFWHLRKAECQGSNHWYDALGSFRKEVVLWHERYIPDIRERLVCSQVKTDTFSAVCEQEHVQHVDLIQMDTEGFDFEVIKLIDFERYRPRLLIYENRHFDEQTKQECEQWLRSRGYLLLREVLDTWCVDARPRDDRQARLLAYWRRCMGDKPIAETVL